VSAGPVAGEILFITSSYPRWPGDTTPPFVHHLAKDLRALGWDVQVLAPHAPGAARDEVMDGVPVHRFRYFWPESLQTICYDGGALVKLRANRWNYTRIPFLVVAQWFAILARIARRNVTLLHSHWLLPQGFTAICASRLTGVAHVTSVHGSDIFSLQGRVLRACKRLVIRHADAVTVNSTATRAAVEELTPTHRVLVRIPMGASAEEVDIEAEAAALRAQWRRGGGPLLVFVGRLVPEKGVDDLLDAIHLLQSSTPDVTGLIVGDGPDRVRLEQLATNLGITSRIAFCGWLSPLQVRIHLGAADYFVGPSRVAVGGGMEAQGLTLIEAMMAGLPVVSTASGGITDAIRHDATGLVVQPAAPAEIAGAIRRLVANPALAARLGSAARELALQEFTRETCARRFSKLYARLAAQPSARRKK
jgi:glycosyltransferase involved in cell wall biosynthesis